MSGFEWMVTAVLMVLVGLVGWLLVSARRGGSATTPRVGVEPTVQQRELATAVQDREQRVTQAEAELASAQRQLERDRDDLARQHEELGREQDRVARTRDDLAGRLAEADQVKTRAEALRTETEGAGRELDARRRELLERDQAVGERLEAAEQVSAKAAREAASAHEVSAQLDRRAADLTEREQWARRREERLEAEAEEVRDRARAVDERAEALRQREHDLAERSEQLDVRERELLEAEQTAAGLTADEARSRVLERAAQQARLEAITQARDIEQAAKTEADRRARTIIATAIGRLAAAEASDAVITTVELPSDEMKGRIIGREGRNIRAFEQLTGVNVLVDDTPGLVLLSSFDPVRREVARMTLTALVADGRIHPASIEHAYDRSLDLIDERIMDAAEDALIEVGIADLDPDLKPVLGSLRYRTSYGQNVLEHLIESAHLAGLMAAELGLDPTTAVRAAFLHDIGKALTHEVEGPHALVGADLLRRHGEHEDVVHAVEAHHNEVEPRTVEALLTQAADAISGARPGARRQTLESYVRRMDQVERIAGEHEGVERVFAMQAGREVRVMVVPELVDDDQAAELARTIAEELHQEVTFPGQIQVTVIRESRATATAT